jgi:hypothetical protein
MAAAEARIASLEAELARLRDSQSEDASQERHLARKLKALDRELQTLRDAHRDAQHELAVERASKSQLAQIHAHEREQARKAADHIREAEVMLARESARFDVERMRREESVVAAERNVLRERVQALRRQVLELEGEVAALLESPQIALRRFKSRVAAVRADVAAARAQLARQRDEEARYDAELRTVAEPAAAPQADRVKLEVMRDAARATIRVYETLALEKERDLERLERALARLSQRARG